MTLRVIVVTQDDPFYVPVFFESFFATLPESVKVERVVCLDPFDESTFDLARRMYGFYGPTNFVRRGVEFSYRKAVDGRFGKRYSVRSVAAEYDVTVEDRVTVNDDEFVNDIEAADIHVVLSVSAPEIFDSHLLEAPSWGCLNVHTAALPKYRGMMPTFWALYHGDDEVGVTVHTMREELDRGEAVARDSFPVDSTDTLDDVILEGKRRGGRAAARALADIVTKSVDRIPLEGDGSYFSFPTPEERRELQSRGRRLL